MTTRTDPDVLYEYAMLGAQANAHGLLLSASRTHIVIRDGKTLQQVILEPSIAAAQKRLQYEIDNGYHEHSKRLP